MDVRLARATPDDAAVAGRLLTRPEQEAVDELTGPPAP
jgi:hypothetical protein